MRARRALRREVIEQIRLIAAVAAVAGQTEPALIGKFTAVGLGRTYAAFLARSFAQLAEAKKVEAILTAHGLPAGTVERLATLLTRLEAESEQVSLHRRAHVGAHAALNRTSRTVTELGSLLDALNRARFREDPKQLAAWASARNVVSARGSAKPVSQVPEPAGPELGRAA